MMFVMAFACIPALSLASMKKKPKRKPTGENQHERGGNVFVFLSFIALLFSVIYVVVVVVHCCLSFPHIFRFHFFCIFCVSQHPGVIFTDLCKGQGLHLVIGSWIIDRLQWSSSQEEGEHMAFFL